MQLEIYSLASFEKERSDLKFEVRIRRVDDFAVLRRRFFMHRILVRKVHRDPAGIIRRWYQLVQSVAGFLRRDTEPECGESRDHDGGCQEPARNSGVARGALQPIGAWQRSRLVVLSAVVCGYPVVDRLMIFRRY